MQAESGGHIGRVEKQLGLNLQVSGGRLKLYRDLGLLMSNGFHLKHAWCKVQGTRRISFEFPFIESLFELTVSFGGS